MAKKVEIDVCKRNIHSFHTADAFTEYKKHMWSTSKCLMMSKSETHWSSLLSQYEKSVLATSLQLPLIQHCDLHEGSTCKSLYLVTFIFHHKDVHSTFITMNGRPWQNLSENKTPSTHDTKKKSTCTFQYSIEDIHVCWWQGVEQLHHMQCPVRVCTTRRINTRRFSIQYRSSDTGYTPTLPR